MKKQPLFSVVVPLYNKAPYISRSIKSILDQSVEDLELIVIDDGSTDDGADIVCQFNDPRIRLIQQENQGESGARNRGIEKSNSKYISFLDADDEWKPDFLQTINNLIGKYLCARIFATAYELYTPNKGIIRPIISNSAFNESWDGILTDYFKNLLWDQPFNSSSVTIRKSIFDEIGGFPIGVKYGGDLDFWIRAALKFPIAYSCKAQSIYHKEAENRVSNYNSYQCNIPFENTINVALRNHRLPNSTKDDLRILLRHHRNLAVYQALLNSNSKLAKYHAAKIEKCGFFDIGLAWWKLWGVSTITYFSTSEKISKKIFTKH